MRWDVRFVPKADIPPFQSIVVGADGSCIAGRLSFTLAGGQRGLRGEIATESSSVVNVGLT
jgi:hypothetical protein